MKRGRHSIWNMGCFEPINSNARRGLTSGISKAKDIIIRNFTERVIVRKNPNRRELGIDISNHAITCFCDRLKYMGHEVPPNPEEKINNILSIAVPSDIPKRLQRVTNNETEKVEHLVALGWRFVISNNVLIAVERIKRKENQPPSLQPKRKKIKRNKEIRRQGNGHK